jgi:hypothetical protein
MFSFLLYIVYGGTVLKLDGTITYTSCLGNNHQGQQVAAPSAPQQDHH